MEIVAGVVIDVNDDPIYWHLPEDRRQGLCTRDNVRLWHLVWDYRDQVLGIAFVRPGVGEVSANHDDLGLFLAVESVLARRLAWWIVNEDSFAELQWSGPGAWDYARVAHEMYPPSWVPALRDLASVCCKKMSPGRVV